MIRSLLVPTLSLATLALHAQNWLVNQPVDVQVSAVTVYGGGCFPATQAILNFSAPAVDGVTYFYKVIGITTDGEYTMVPGPAVALQVDDMIPVSVQDNQVFNTGTFGGLELQVWAVGTPTMEGQAHPCSSSELWMSNLLLCNEGLTAIVQTNCATELSTGLTDMDRSTISYIPPSSMNGYQLQLTVNEPVSGRIIDMQGRVVAMFGTDQRTIDLSGLPGGVYVLTLLGNTGQIVHSTFTI